MTQATAERPDTQEMVVVHRMFRREFRLAPALVRSVQAGDTERAGVVAAHVTELCTVLHHHHSGEDELVWPRLHARTPVSSDLVARMEGQHEQVGGLLGRVEHLVPAWAHAATAGMRDELAGVLDELAPALEQHLDEEEAHVLPLIAEHLSKAEWDELGERGVAAIPKQRLLVLFGYMLEDTTPQEQAMMLGVMPPPARLLYRAVGRRKHVKERDRIRGGVAVPQQRRA